MSNIKLGYAANYHAYAATEGSTIADGGDVYSYSRGSRAVYTSRSSTGTGFTVAYDFGSGNDKAFDTVFVARADMLQDTAVSQFALQRSSNGSSWTNQYGAWTFSTDTLACPTATDFIDTFTLSSAYRYWRINFSGTATNFKHSKHCFCTGFDFGDDPVAVIPSVSHESYSTEHASGDITFLRMRRPQRTYKITWRGITDAKVYSLDTEILMWPDMPMFLYTTTDHEILGDFRVVQVKPRGKPVVKTLANDYNEITIDFIEQLG